MGKTVCKISSFSFYSLLNLMRVGWFPPRNRWVPVILLLSLSTSNLLPSSLLALYAWAAANRRRLFFCLFLEKTSAKTRRTYGRFLVTLFFLRLRAPNKKAKKRKKGKKRGREKQTQKAENKNKKKPTNDVAGVGRWREYNSLHTVQMYGRASYSRETH